MLCMMLIMSIINSTIFIFMKHPLSLGMILLIQTIQVSLIIGLFNLNYWFSYILMLVMVGGMLILFIYMTSIASNEKFKFSLNLSIYLMLISILMLMIYFIIDNNIISYNFNYNLMFNKENMNPNYSMSKFYNFPNNLIMYMIIIYLLITLIAIVKITKFSKKPLRQMF
uniref:NADH-ubiquinone oxidoreductase chain 6 n=1 Tax=Teredus cylindricus TaxID=295808 RepID=S4SUX9_TERCY|nr:NADH dehydrogenase subunit 6 [Teredus cylindricus]